MATKHRSDTAKEVHPVPDGYHSVTSVTPFVIVKGAAKLPYFCKYAFGPKKWGAPLGNDWWLMAHTE